ncbi:ABC transporter ATP-binding protein [Phaeacidiphilus oryzae]|uniref:ABC transporter ATP-binding protein n=1 Tax=Phaeacidiphilus oryzae TaxID=348818 RepID=UPI00069131BC|nr:ABC transporter ATP-binding protein [Phaeacidiphilus oryzae]
MTGTPARPLLRIEDVHRDFGGLRALAGCSLAVETGTVTGLIGPNGSGKTTLFNVVTGYDRPDSGRVRLDGQEITGAAPDAVGRLGLARTFQLTRVFDRLSLLDNLRVGAAAVPRARRQALYRESRCLELLDVVGLVDHADRRAGELSYGQRKLVELATVLAQQPRIVLLDEPAGGVNPGLIARIGGLIRELNRSGTTFLVVEHNMEFVMGVCDTVAVMERGEVIAQGEPEAIRTDPRVLDAYLGGGLDDEPFGAEAEPGEEG